MGRAGLRSVFSFNILSNVFHNFVKNEILLLTLYYIICIKSKSYMRRFIQIITAVIIIISLNNCTLKKQVSVKDLYPPTVGNISVIQTNQYLPTNIYRIGSIVVGENGLTPNGKCTYEACMRTIEEESRKVGAQLVYIVRVKEPDYYSSCYNITAELYRYTE